MTLTVSRQVREELMSNLDALCPKLLSNLLTKTEPSFEQTAHDAEEKWNLLKTTLLKSEEQRVVYGVNENNVDEILYGRLRILLSTWRDFEDLRINKLRIPEDLIYRFWNFYLPFTEWTINRRKNTPKDRSYILGINGGQGSGKSTLVEVAKFLLEKQGYEVVAVSIDDFYMNYKDRVDLKKRVCWYKHRGLPGTHYVNQVIRIFRRLKYKMLNHEKPVKIPRFYKNLKNGSGDVAPKKDWQNVEKVDIVLAEGWFWGCRSLQEEELDKPSGNDLVDMIEKRDDPNGIFRRIVNRALEKYHKLFDLCDNLVVLKVPSLEKIREWRKEQERKLKEEKGTGMSDKQLDEFLDYFATFTQRYVIPLDVSENADLVVTIGDSHETKKVATRRLEPVQN